MQLLEPPSPPGPVQLGKNGTLRTIARPAALHYSSGDVGIKSTSRTAQQCALDANGGGGGGGGGGLMPVVGTERGPVLFQPAGLSAAPPGECFTILSDVYRACQCFKSVSTKQASVLPEQKRASWPGCWVRGTELRGARARFHRAVTGKYLGDKGVVGRGAASTQPYDLTSLYLTFQHIPISAKWMSDSKYASQITLEGMTTQKSRSQ